MTPEKLRTILSIGETVVIEFKRCANGISADTFKTVCSFLNRFGGDIFLGVDDSGAVHGVPKNTASSMVKSFIQSVGNPEIIYPTVHLAPEILEYEKKYVIRVHVPPSSEVHSYKNVVYNRLDASDVKVTAAEQITALYMRKHNIFSEKRVYPNVRENDLRLDLLPFIRHRAVSRIQDHEWNGMSDTELLRSAGLIGKDLETGEQGYNLAAIMLLGRDDLIHSICPSYRTDAILRRTHLEEKVIVKTNLIESYDLLVQFAEKHLPDKFYMEEDTQISLRGTIVREILVNTLIHREFTSSYTAKFIIEKDRMYTENANRAMCGDMITPDNLEPNPKNSIIAAFFRNIWLADELGSGVRKLYRYVPLYSGKPPELLDGDVFRIVVPLDDAYSFDDQSSKVKDKPHGKVHGKPHADDDNHALIENEVLNYLRENPNTTQTDIASAIGKSRHAVHDAIAALKEAGQLQHDGTKNHGHWIVKQ